MKITTEKTEKKLIVIPDERLDIHTSQEFNDLTMSAVSSL